MDEVIHRDPAVKHRTPQLCRDKVVARGHIMESVETVPHRFKVALLVAKLHSETEEIALDLSNPEEYGDLLETLVALAGANGVTWHEIVKAASEKREKKGGLEDGVFWTSEPFMRANDVDLAA